MVDRFMVAATDFGNPSQAVQSVRFTVMIVMTAVQNKCSVAVFAGVHAVAAPGLQPAYLVECCGFIHRTAEVLVESQRLLGVLQRCLVFLFTLPHPRQSPVSVRLLDGDTVFLGQAQGTIQVHERARELVQVCVGMAKVPVGTDAGGGGAEVGSGLESGDPHGDAVVSISLSLVVCRRGPGQSPCG